MSKTSRSQWDFGELFPPEQTRKVWSVSELTVQIRRALESALGLVWVTGEVTNLRVQSSGHSYFTLKDASSQLSCVLFRGERVAHRELLQDGQKLLIQGDLTVYEARGQYQLIVRAVELQGQGALQLAFERLKQKLQAEGLFASERKRPLPEFPQRIGLVTSPTGAALRDVLHVAKRRNPGLEFILAPCRVQGDGAAREIASAIRALNEFSRTRTSDFEMIREPAEGTASNTALDLILVTRGGGSLEDLWAFNEEVVARAIFDSLLPVVSAVGHEIDFTISDFVADVRAATPSAAAEIITEGVFSSCEFVSEAAKRIRMLVQRQLVDKEVQTTALIKRLVRVHPRRRFSEWLQRLDDLVVRSSRCSRSGLRQNKVRVATAVDRLVRIRPRQQLQLRCERLSATSARLYERAARHLRDRRNRLATLQARLRLLGPEQVLARGYSITRVAETGEVLRSAESALPGQVLHTRLARGVVASRVEPGAAAS